MEPMTMEKQIVLLGSVVVLYVLGQINEEEIPEEDRSTEDWNFKLNVVRLFFNENPRLKKVAKKLLGMFPPEMAQGVFDRLCITCRPLRYKIEDKRIVKVKKFKIRKAYGH